MVVEVDLNKDYVLVRFSKVELAKILQKAMDRTVTVKDIFDEIMRVGFNQVAG